MESEVDDVLDLGGIASEIRKTGVARPACLVGQLCCDKKVNSFALLEVMKKAFRSKGKLTVRDWGGGLLVFSFEVEADRDWVIQNQPWHFDNYLFAVKPLSSMEQPSSVSTKVSLWIRALDIPIAFQSVAVIKSLAAKFGTLECYEVLDELSPNRFLRFKVSIDYTHPLLRGLYIRFEGEPVWIDVRYESLPVYCFCCGVIGHHYRNCKDFDHDAPGDVTAMRYGNALQAPLGNKGLLGSVVHVEQSTDESIPKLLIQAPMPTIGNSNAMQTNGNPNTTPTMQNNHNLTYVPTDKHPAMQTIRVFNKVPTMQNNPSLTHVPTDKPNHISSDFLNASHPDNTYCLP
ncbi:hypothetical protein ACS0TY_024286 [Phlomoides rotata]